MDAALSTRVWFFVSFLGQIGLANAGQYYYYKSRHDTCARKATPCYDYALTFLMDGSSDDFLGNNRSKILAHHQLAGRSEADAIQEGKMATAWLKTKYGIDFTGVEDDVYLDGTKAVTSDDVTLTFRAFIVDSATRNRFVSASKGHKVEFFNAPISEAGWMVTVNEAISAGGTFNRTLPRGAMIFYGDFVIPLCDRTGMKSNSRMNKNNYYSCRNIFNQKTLKIHYESGKYCSSVDGVSVINNVVNETSWGVGSARGSLFVEGNKYCGRSVFTFPASKP
ncbi:uncharacterized protein LOC106161796 [Lingula anatina]|uniref:Uncharacterized protein LOC106161796 n=1 Tax=Lingula anatina TaxID=7574 RepID=A0A1S3IA44_LINAN|nr:uncharacterized protein LOC106161796 [Lingula anatina]|eukprot:XP_013394279.1 uncharacterized protein LOC106161796 [Lingula anatina]